MDKTSLRNTFSWTFLTIYALYGLFMIGMTGLLFSFAIGLIVSSFNTPIELVTASTILSGLVWKVITDRRGRRSEGFQGSGVPTGTGDNLTAIAKKIEQIKRKDVFVPSGVLSSNFVEGFADASVTDAPTPDSGSANAKPVGEAAAASATSAPAGTNAPTASPQMANAAVAANPAAASTPPAQPAADGFTSQATAGMFKLGSIPADSVGGSHIDMGTTLTNALNALKPDQVKAMTEDTRKLLETQKSLMSMLGSMKPMLQDGKQLMETFGEMFGKQ